MANKQPRRAQRKKKTMEEAKKQFRELVYRLTPAQWEAIYRLLKENELQAARELMNDIAQQEVQK